MKSSRKDLPLPPGIEDEAAFRDEILKFVSSCERWQILCGGIHMLDFLVRAPDLYEDVLPTSWRAWLGGLDILDVIDLLNNVDISHLKFESYDDNTCSQWRGYPKPPSSLISYVATVRSFLFDRSFQGHLSRVRESHAKTLNRQLATGMNEKKIHEVENFSAFISDLCTDMSASGEHSITDVVDFGAGQGYLGRCLASSLYNIDVVNIESKSHNIIGARRNDVMAKVAKKEIVYRNKKLFRAGIDGTQLANEEHGQAMHKEKNVRVRSEDCEKTSERTKHGTIRHIEHRIVGGDLEPVIKELKKIKTSETVARSDRVDKQSELLVVSLHSCGNLLHHGLRSLTANSSVKAVAMIGCCYNLCTERIGGPTFKLPNLRLRAQNQRLLETSNACDADGFPMSEHFVKYKHADGTGIKLNITARMMAVQAPRNWTRHECEGFFIRHWYRALLQRIFLEHGIVQLVDLRGQDSLSVQTESNDLAQPITIGKLAKSSYGSFTAYVKAALQKLKNDDARGTKFEELVESLTDTDIMAYEERFAHRRHELCVLWSFMAFSAGVVETLIVLDRWQWLHEQPEVSRAWVQPVFDYAYSPRNLAVIGIKKR